ncbi:MAG: DUF294 nucleotidyltransferase-like domain-containing protein [Bacteroidota bacterium]
MIDQGLTTRVSDFLGIYPPFSFLPRDIVEDLAGKVRVKYYMENEYVFHQGDEPLEYIFVLNKGSVELSKLDQGSERLVDICDDGDVFGIRSFITENPYQLSAKAAEDTLVYALPKAEFSPLLEVYPKVALYFAAGLASGLPNEGELPGHLQKAQRELLSDTGQSSLFREEDVLIVNAKNKIITCSEDATIQEVAQIMTDQRIGSVVIADQEKRPLGIVTNVDFTRKVMTTAISRHSPVKDIMSSPVMTIANGRTVASIILIMMRQNLRHLVVTEDGTAETKVIGVVSERDILLMQGNNPAVLIKQIMKTSDEQVLANIRDRAGDLIHNYLKQEISIPFIADLMTEINDALIERAIVLSIEKLEADGMKKPALRFCWLSLGSEGRGEQLLRTDQDNAILYEDPPEDQAEYARDYFLKLGEEINRYMIVFGYEECPAEIMARNPKWNQPLSGWKKHFLDWISVPEPKALMHGTIFFDFRAEYGDISLADELYDFLFDEIKRQPLFFSLFAQNALENPPPLSFFKNFIVERGGSHKNKFDIKLRGMMPLADAARALTFKHEQRHITNTFKRFENLAELDPPNARVYNEAAMAYELLMRYRALNGFANNNSGRYIDPKKLNKIERQTLKYSFSTIEDVQSLLKTQFDLTFFRG